MVALVSIDTAHLACVTSITLRVRVIEACDLFLSVAFDLGNPNKCSIDKRIHFHFASSISRIHFNVILSHFESLSDLIVRGPGGCLLCSCSILQSATARSTVWLLERWGQSRQGVERLQHCPTELLRGQSLYECSN